jgi:arylsulfatase A-like enzyme
VLAGCHEREPRSLLLITVDTLRPDRLGLGGHSRATSPNLDQLAAEGVHFERAFSQAGWTLPAVASILTGLPPSRHGAVAADRGLAPDVPTLATLLGGRGYDTRAYVSHLFLRARYGLAGGFAAYDDSVLAVGHPHRVATGVALTDRVLRDVATLEAPFFLWVHYFDPHFAYLAHREWPFGTSAEDRYDAEIAYVDHEIGRLLRALESRDLLVDALVVVTADHGEQFGEHGGRFHYGLWNEIVGVPLIIRGPGLEHQVRQDAAQHIDLLPTLLRLLDVEAPPRLPGRDLFAEGRVGAPIFIERSRPAPLVQEAVIDGDWKLVRVRVEGGQQTELARATELVGLAPGTYLFDVAKDTGETRNLLLDRGREASRLLALLESHASAAREGQAVELDPETERQLRSLGYLQ